jgi:hypothetical protein
MIGRRQVGEGGQQLAGVEVQAQRAGQPLGATGEGAAQRRGHALGQIIPGRRLQAALPEVDLPMGLTQAGGIALQPCLQAQPTLQGRQCGPQGAQARQGEVAGGEGQLPLWAGHLQGDLQGDCRAGGGERQLQGAGIQWVAQLQAEFHRLRPIPEGQPSLFAMDLCAAQRRRGAGEADRPPALLQGLQPNLLGRELEAKGFPRRAQAQLQLDPPRLPAAAGQARGRQFDPFHGARRGVGRDAGQGKQRQQRRAEVHSAGNTLVER